MRGKAKSSSEALHMGMDDAALSRFLERVEIDASGCWVWRGGRMSHGYGRFALHGRMVLAHRVSYSHFVGEIPAGLQIDHLCRVRWCVNPEHLEVVTLLENLARGEGKNAAPLREDRCKRGHALTPENTYERPEGRRCRECRRIGHRRRRGLAHARG